MIGSVEAAAIYICAHTTMRPVRLCLCLYPQVCVHAAHAWRHRLRHAPAAKTRATALRAHPRVWPATDGAQSSSPILSANNHIMHAVNHEGTTHHVCTHI